MIEIFCVNWCIKVIAGVDVERYHCWIENTEGEVTLYPVDDALCAVNGNVVNEPTKLTQGTLKLMYVFMQI